MVAAAMRRSTAAALVFVLGLAPSPAVLAHPEIDVLERAAAEEVAQRPDDPEVHLRQAQTHRAAGNWDAALVALAHAAEHGADADEIGAARGRVFLDAGWARMAKLELDRVLAHQPDRFAVLFERGRAWSKLGHPDEAARDFGRAIAGLPEPRPEQVFAHRDALLAAGRPDEALQALDAGIARLGAVPSLELAAVDLAEDLGRHEDALRRLERLLAASPRNEAWLTRRGEILARAGRREEARADFAHALALIEARPPARRGKRIEALQRQLRTALAVARTEGKP
jgi:tetratricopeptide (TPR) repeat protein